MKRLTFLLVIALMSLSVHTYAQKDDSMIGKSLYERLGGEEGISTIVEEVVDAHFTNPVLKDRFLPYKGTPELAKAKMHLKAFFAAGSGGPNNYQGRTMEMAHKGMNITVKEYMAAIDDNMMVLKKHEFDVETQKDVLFILYSLKDSMIGK